MGFYVYIVHKLLNYVRAQGLKQQQEGGVDGHGTNGLSPTLPRLTCPLLVGCTNVVRSKKGQCRAITIEDFEEKGKHHLLNLGSRDRRGQLNGIPDKMSMHHGKEFNPVNR